MSRSSTKKGASLVIGKTRYLLDPAAALIMGPAFVLRIINGVSLNSGISSLLIAQLTLVENLLISLVRKLLIVVMLHSRQKLRQPLKL